MVEALKVFLLITDISLGIYKTAEILQILGERGCRCRKELVGLLHVLILRTIYHGIAQPLRRPRKQAVRQTRQIVQILIQCRRITVAAFFLLLIQHIGGYLEHR